MKKMKSKKVIVECHQHVDKNGIKFGGSHPIEASHKNLKTQAHHDRTVSLDAFQDK